MRTKKKENKAASKSTSHKEKDMQLAKEKEWKDNNNNTKETKEKEMWKENKWQTPATGVDNQDSVQHSKQQQLCWATECNSTMVFTTQQVALDWLCPRQLRPASTTSESTTFGNPTSTTTFSRDGSNQSTTNTSHDFKSWDDGRKDDNKYSCCSRLLHGPSSNVTKRHILQAKLDANGPKNGSASRSIFGTLTWKESKEEPLPRSKFGTARRRMVTHLEIDNLNLFNFK